MVNFLNIFILSVLLFSQVMCVLSVVKYYFPILFALISKDDYIPINFIVLLYQELDAETLIKLKIISIIGFIAYIMLAVQFVIRFLLSIMSFWKKIIFYLLIAIILRELYYKYSYIIGFTELTTYYEYYFNYTNIINNIAELGNTTSTNN